MKVGNKAVWRPAMMACAEVLGGLADKPMLTAEGRRSVENAHIDKLKRYWLCHILQ